MAISSSNISRNSDDRADESNVSIMVFQKKNRNFFVVRIFKWNSVLVRIRKLYLSRLITYWYGIGFLYLIYFIIDDIALFSWFFIFHSIQYNALVRITFKSTSSVLNTCSLLIGTIRY